MKVSLTNDGPRPSGWIRDGALMNAVTTTLDHVVVAARSLDEGRAWCRETLGVAKPAEAASDGLATHNTLLRLGSA